MSGDLSDESDLVGEKALVQGPHPHPVQADAARRGGVEPDCHSAQEGRGEHHGAQAGDTCEVMMDESIEAMACDNTLFRKKVKGG